MALDLEEMKKKIDEFLANITQEEINKYFPPDTRPKGWLSIEEYLPMMCAIDIVQGYTLYKVKDKNGNEFESAVSDHNSWYYYAKEEGITHWWNGEQLLLLTLKGLVLRGLCTKYIQPRKTKPMLQEVRERKLKY